MIKYYDKYGKLNHEEELIDNNLKGINGMMCKCYLKSGKEIVGYGDPFRFNESITNSEIYDYIYLWKWKNLDEVTHTLIGDDSSKYDHIYEKVNIEDIDSIDAIMYSNPRWGGPLTNVFKFSRKEDNKDNVDVELPDFLLKIMKERE